MAKEIMLTNKTATIFLVLGFLIAGVLGPIKGVSGTDQWILTGVWLAIGAIYTFLMIISPTNLESLGLKLEVIPNVVRKLLVWLLVIAVVYYGVSVMFNLMALIGSVLFSSSLFGVHYAAKALLNGTLTLLGAMGVIGLSYRFQMTQSVFNLFVQLFLGFWALITLLVLLSI